MSDLIKIVVLPMTVVIFIIVLIYVIKAIIRNLRFNPEEVSLKNGWVRSCFYDEAHYLVQRKFNMHGKPVYTQKGEYRANYMNEVNKTAKSILHECCEGSRLSRDFCDFIFEVYPDIKRKELQSAIADFRKDRFRAMQENMDDFLNRSETITPEEFFEIKQQQKGDVVGVYIIHNETNDQYYVGQAKRLFFRINQHFTGHGNGDVYADYKYGDDFSIKIIRLSESGYDDIDQLEKDMIERYHAFSAGYNRTSGNK